MHCGILLFFILIAYGATAEDTCPPTEIMKLAELYTNPHLHACGNMSANFSIALPTDSQVKAMCTFDTCRALIEDVLALKPADCYLSFAEVKLNAYKLASNFKNVCETNMDKKNGSWKLQPTVKPRDTTSAPKGDTGHHLKQEELKFVKDVNGTHLVGANTTKNADELKPPIHTKAKELFPFANTTYKATGRETFP
ncbi:unnamed protein product [Peronospora belbahrii]|uniref:Elicitin n=1 Tax=Peronospora belbahrii TaxID=622444 RepID=A0AAU9LJ90_9STRA|nr:unnamed protein product [Peronospora belbahrii]CAH0522304.1 unnamed protein product [Peronospora belbahrii]